jgi:hypothetical protein
MITKFTFYAGWSCKHKGSGQPCSNGDVIYILYMLHCNCGHSTSCSPLELQRSKVYSWILRNGDNMNIMALKYTE